MNALIKVLHFALTGILLVAAISVSVNAGSTMYKGYETPRFTVAASDGAFELRRYEPHVVAEVHVEGERGSAIRRGFRALAGFIFGKNADAAKIAMTAPVTQAETDGLWQVQFMMPAAYDLETLPEPEDERIRLRRTDAETQAVVQFSGWWSDRMLAEKTAALRGWIAARDLEIVEGPRFHFYDDPFTLPMRRRNEVAFRVE